MSHRCKLFIWFYHMLFRTAYFIDFSGDCSRYSPFAPFAKVSPAFPLESVNFVALSVAQRSRRGPILPKSAFDTFRWRASFMLAAGERQRALLSGADAWHGAHLTEMNVVCHVESWRIVFA